MSHEQFRKKLELDAVKQEVARGYTSGLPQDLAGDLGALCYFRRALHLEVDAFGNRLTPGERRILSKTHDVLQRRIRDRWVEEGKPGPEGPEQHYRTYDPYVRTELVNRYLERISPK